MNPKSVHDKVASLEDRVRQLESELQERLNVLEKAEELLATVTRSGIGRCGDHYIYTTQIDKKFADKLHQKIERALRNAGVTEE